MRSKIAVFTTVWSSLLSFWCSWLMNIDDHIKWNCLRLAAAVSEDGSLFSTVWRWYYDRNDYQEQCLYYLTSAITWLSAIGPYLWDFRCCDCMNADDNSWGFLEIFSTAVLSSAGFFLVFWLWFGCLRKISRVVGN